MSYAENSIGTRIFETREATGLSQRELAEQAGISQSIISKIETGEIQNPGTDVVQKIAKVLVVGVAWLIGQGGKPEL